MHPMYISGALRMLQRVSSMIPSHPEILEMTDAYQLFDIEGFMADDLDVSLFQAQWALDQAKEDFRSNQP